MSVAEPLPLLETVEPADQAELAAIVGAAYRDERPVYPIGGGTALGYGAAADAPGLGLVTRRLARVVDYPHRDMTITVEAGIGMATLEATLAACGQRLPIECPHVERATLGGVVATNTSGPRRYGSGTMRDYVIGISAVDGRGMAFKGGGRVVKNVAGYDFCKLLTGSLGTLAVISQVTLKLKPLPDAAAFVCCSLASLAEAERLLAGLVTSQTTPMAIEWLAGRDWDADEAIGATPAGAAGRLLVGFEGTRIEVDWQVARLEREWREAGVPRVMPIDPAHVNGLWRRLTDFPAEQRGAITARFVVLPSKLPELMGTIRHRDPDCVLAAHAGNGVLTVHFSAGPPRADDRGWWEQFLWQAAAQAKGSVTVLRASSHELLTAEHVWGPPDGARHLMRQIKQQFDPKGLLNPGRFVY